jgi:hypothetical protein
MNKGDATVLIPACIVDAAAKMGRLNFREKCQMGVQPGTNGMPEEIWKTREGCFKRMK